MRPAALHLLGSSVTPAQGLATSTGPHKGGGGGHVLTSGHGGGEMVPLLTWAWVCVQLTSATLVSSMYPGGYLWDLPKSVLSQLLGSSLVTPH